VTADLSCRFETTTGHRSIDDTPRNVKTIAGLLAGRRNGLADLHEEVGETGRHPVARAGKVHNRGGNARALGALLRRRHFGAVSNPFHRKGQSHAVRRVGSGQRRTVEPKRALSWSFFFIFRFPSRPFAVSGQRLYATGHDAQPVHVFPRPNKCMNSSALRSCAKKCFRSTIPCRNGHR